MDRRQLIPRAILGALTVLTAVAAFWAVHDAPSIATPGVESTAAAIANERSAPTPSLKVLAASHATFGQPVGSNAFSLILRSAVSANLGKGIITSEVRIRFTPPDALTASDVNSNQVLTGQRVHLAIATALADGSLVEGTIAWTGAGPTFHRIEPITTFDNRVDSAQAAKTQPKLGMVYETVTVRDGFLIGASFNLLVPQQTLDGGHLSAGGAEQETFQLLTIAGAAAPAAPIAPATPSPANG